MGPCQSCRRSSLTRVIGLAWRSCAYHASAACASARPGSAPRTGRLLQGSPATSGPADRSRAVANVVARVPTRGRCTTIVFIAGSNSNYPLKTGNLAGLVLFFRCSLQLLQVPPESLCTALGPNGPRSGAKPSPSSTRVAGSVNAAQVASAPGAISAAWQLSARDCCGMTR